MAGAELKIEGALSTLGRQRKVHLPEPLLKVAAWPVPSELVAELYAAGCVRLYLETDVRARLEAIRSEIEKREPLERLEFLAAFEDRYRSVPFYTASGERTVQLPVAVSAYLGVSMQGNREIYLEAKNRAIDIMSPEYRARRQENLKNDISL